MTDIGRCRAVFLVLALALTLVSCSGGGFSKDGAVPELVVAITGCNTLTDPMSGESIICIDYTVTGDAGQAFNIAYLFFLDTGAPNLLDGESTFAMTEITSTQEAQFGVTSGTLSSLPTGQTSVSGTFCWSPGADLGFVGQNGNICIYLDISPGGGSPAGQTVTDGLTCGKSYNGGQPPIGPPNFSNALADHTAHAITSSSTEGVATPDSVVVANGIDATFTERDEVERYQFDLTVPSGNIPFASTTEDPRTHTAAAAYYDVNNNIRIMTCGGFATSGAFGSTTNGGGNNPVSDADVYTFVAEGVSLVGSMNQARALHTATWLPDNRILVVGGRTDSGDGGSSATNIVEMFDPLTETFFTVAPMPDNGRERHTACLLPDGRVLVAGGKDPDNPGQVLDALIYTPDYVNKSGPGSWVTDCPVDRYDHTATLLVNGVCYHVGGRRTSDDTVLDTALAFRTYAAGGHPAGFSKNAPALEGVGGGNPFIEDMMVEPRTQHAASRLGDGSILVSGGFNGNNPKLTHDTAELLIPICFTFTQASVPILGTFSSTNSLLAASRARHTQTTTNSGSAVVVGGVTTDTNPPNLTVLDSVEIYRFTNARPTVSNITANTANHAAVQISFDIADVEGDKCFVFFRWGDAAAPANGVCFGTLNNPMDASNIDPSGGPVNVTLSWNAIADGLSAGQQVVLEILPVGGAFGVPQRITVSL